MANGGLEQIRTSLLLSVAGDGTMCMVALVRGLLGPCCSYHQLVSYHHLAPPTVVPAEAASTTAIAHVLCIFEAAPPAAAWPSSAEGPAGGVAEGAAEGGGDVLLARVAEAMSDMRTLSDMGMLWDELLQELHMRWVGGAAGDEG